MKKVCIIGSGAAGLAAIRYVSESPYLEGTVFEQNDKIGGLWVYSDKIRDEKGEQVHSSMYASLRTHLPKQLMAYPDFPFGETQASFVTHKEMIKYMKDYVSFYKLMRYIRYRHRVVNVKPVEQINSKNVTWMVTIQNMQTETLSVEEFDSVIVCNGHCFKPFQPKLENEHVFEGEIIHSKDYRRPERFIEKKVIVVGGGLSALDISSEISTTATEVLFSHTEQSFDPLWLPENVQQVPKITSVTKGGVILTNGEQFEVDTIMFCTGYEYDYPFLPLDECQVNVTKKKFVSPLFRHFIHSKFTSLSFIGLPFLNAAFPLFDCQARFYVKFLEGKVKLPSEEEMNRQIEYDFNLKKNNGLGIRKSHSMENSPWGYYKTLGNEANFSTAWIPLMKSIFDHVNERRTQFPTLYKNDKVVVKSQNMYEYIAIEETLEMPYY